MNKNFKLVLGDLYALRWGTIADKLCVCICINIDEKNNIIDLFWLNNYAIGSITHDAAHRALKKLKVA